GEELATQLSFPHATFDVRSSPPDSRSCQIGDIALSFAMIPGTISRTRSASSSVVSRESERRITPCKAVGGTSIARRTWDGSVEPDVQADPDEAAIPSLFM